MPADRITFACPHCRTRLKFPVRLAGMSVRCPQCGRSADVPRPRPSQEGAGRSGRVVPVARAVAPGGAARAVPVAAIPVSSRTAGVPVARAVAPGPSVATAASGLDMEGRTRVASLFKLGLALIVGGALPFLAYGGKAIVCQWSVSLLGDEGVPWQVKFLLVWPIVAGVIVILLACAPHNRWRALVLVALFFVPAIAWRDAGDVSGLADDLSRGLRREVLGTSGGLANLLTFLGLGTGLLLVGSRSRWHRPRWGALFLIGAAGAALVIYSQAVPVGIGGERRLPLAFLIEGFKAAARGAKGDAAPLALAVLGLLTGAVVMVLLASVLSLFAFPGQGPGSARTMAGGAFLCARLAVAMLVVLVIFLSVVPMFTRGAGLPAEGVSAAHVLVAIANVAKVMLWFLGLALLLPVGLIDLIIGPPPAGSGGGDGPVLPQAIPVRGA